MRRSAKSVKQSNSVVSRKPSDGTAYQRQYNQADPSSAPTSFLIPLTQARQLLVDDLHGFFCAWEEGYGIRTSVWATVASWIWHIPYFIFSCFSLIWEIVFGVLGVPIVTPEYSALEEQLRQTQNYSEWRVVARMLDELDGYVEWSTEEESIYFSFSGVMSSVQRLAELKQTGTTRALLEALVTQVQRSPYGINNTKLYQYRTGTKTVIHSYTSLVCYLLRGLANDDGGQTTPQQRFNAVRRMRNNYGTTALVLNGGILVAPIHLGVVKALHEARLLPLVIYGRRAGAIVAALICCSRDISSIDKSLFNTDSFVTMRPQSGVTRRRLGRLLSKGHLMDASVLLSCAKESLGELTFMDAYLLTGRVLNIQYTSFFRDSTNPQGPIKRCSCLLNYLTAPNVLVYTAAVSSMASVPVMFGQVQLLSKSLDGSIGEFDPAVLMCCYPLSRNDSSSSVPGNALHRLRELFHIRYFIISECSLARTPLFKWQQSWSDFTITRLVRCVVREGYRLLSIVSSRIHVLNHHLATALENDIPGDVAESGDTMIIYPISSVLELLALWRNSSKEQLIKSTLHCERQVWPRLEEVRIRRAIEQTLTETLVELRCRYPDEINAQDAISGI